MALEEIGRLAMRREGDCWSAYYAMPGTMLGAVFLGSIRIAAVTGNDERKAAFMQMMQDVVSDILEEVVGARPEWPDGPKPAPDNERTGKFGN